MRRLRLFFFGAFALSLIFSSCSDDLIPIPTNEVSESVISFASPQNLTASQGSWRSVILNWSSVDRAYQYYIYSANTPTSNFEQCGETKGALCSYTLTEEPGVVRYYKVCAVKYDGQKSALSNYVQGSTLATPVITYIKNDTESSSSTVSWWMKNCTTLTYKENVRFDIRCYSSDKKNILQEKSVDGTTDSVTFENLESATLYYYQVSAYVTTNQSKTEESTLVDSTTEHCLLPMAPINLLAQKGNSKDSVTLTWLLPDFVEVSTDSAYEYHPVFFKIFRRIKDSSDDFTEICSYAGVLKSDENVTVTQYTGSEEVKHLTGAYEKYVPLSTITYKDKFDITSGTQYEYKVQSFVDDSEDAITSEKLSVSDCVGWSCPIPSFSAEVSYEDGEDDKFSKISVSFKAFMQEFSGGIDYIYLIEETQTNFDTEASNSCILKKYTSISAINDFVREFDDPKNQAGYYSYTLYVLDSAQSGNIDSDYVELQILSVKNLGNITVTDDKSYIPTIENFTITDGYASKFLLSWVYDSSCVYTLNWVDYDSNGTITEEFGSYALTDKDVVDAQNGCDFTYSHTSDSGKCRMYTLVADKGLRVEKTYDSIVKTLGIATPVFEEAEYDSITVTWKPVQKADSYTVTCYYEDDVSNSENYLVQEGEPSTNEWNTTSCELSADDGSNPSLYTCVLKTPYGYANSKISGKPLSFIVTAINTLDKTQTTITVCTLGPALTQTKAESTAANDILISWNKVEGAKGYLIRRVRYNLGNGLTVPDEDSNFDTYYYNGTELKINDEAVSSKQASVSFSENTYTLTDTYCEQENSTSSYEINQSMVSWGIPFGYIVIPVKNSDDFEFEKLSITGSSALVYSNLSDTKNATFGYGLKLRARKAEHATVQTVEWETPYFSTLTPVLYARPSGSEENLWTKIDTLSSGSTSASYKPSELSAAYEYVIAYKKTSSSISLPSSFITDTSSGLSLATMETDGEYYDYTGVALEKLNKGYLLAVDFSAGYGGTKDSDGSYVEDEKFYSEKVEWSEWDYAERSIGPKSAYISIKNYNLSSVWSKVAGLDKNLHYSSAESLTNTTITPSGEVAMYLSPKELASADSVTNGTMINTLGPLMVLRDAKHYYSLTLERDDITATLGSTDTVYGYRQISDAELARAAMLVLSYGFYLHDGGLANYSNATSQFKYTDAGTVNGQTGTMTFTKGEYYGILSSYSGKYHASYSLSGNFAPSQLTPGGVSATCVGLTSASSSFDGGFRLKGSADYYLYQFANTDSIIVTTGDSSIPIDYSATISFICEDTDDLTLKITRNGTTTTLCDTSNNTVRKYWCPMQIHDNKSYVITDSSYGWWTE